MDRRSIITRGLQGMGASMLSMQSGGAPAQGLTLQGWQVWHVSDFGARPGSAVLQTRALQAAIDACTQAGGGTVFIPNGRFLTGTLELKDGVTLHLAPGALLTGSPDAADYPERPFPARDLDVGGFAICALIYADRAKNIGIEGSGTVDGNGRPFPPRPHGKNRDISTGKRPRLLFLKDCTNVHLRDVTLRDSGCWTVHLALCREATIHGIKIFSNFFYNQDGIVLDSCQDATVSDCYVNASDDAIVIKSSFPAPCKNVVVTNCVLTTTCAAIKFGSQSLGGFQNVSISNCVCYDCRLGGLKFEAVDGGDLEDVSVSNLTMHNVSAPLTFIVGNRGEDYGFMEVTRPRPVARLRNVVVSGLRASVANNGPEWHKGNTCLITGIPGHPVEGVILENISMTFPGNGTRDEATRVITDQANAYPENTMLGVLPAYGFYLRHARGVVLNNIKMELTASDARPALMCEDCDDMRVTNLRASSAGSDALMVLRETRNALFQGCASLGSADVFLRVEGPGSTGIAMSGNDLRNVRQLVDKQKGFLGKVADVGKLHTV